MKWLYRTGIALTASFIITMAVVVGSFIWLMFSSTEADGQRLGLFGAVFFEARDNSEGATEIGFGIVNGYPILIIFLVLVGFSLAVAVMFDRLKEYKKELVRNS